MRRTRIGAALAIAIAFACSTAAPVKPPVDAGSDHTGTVHPDGMAPAIDAAPRLTPHNDVTLPGIQLGVIYVGDADAGGAPTSDTTLTWLVSSPYWGLLHEYGVNPGALIGSVRVATTAFLHSGDIQNDDAGQNSLIDILVLQARIAESIHGDVEAGTGGVVSIPGAQAYLVYLPDGLNVALGHRGNYTYQTCIDASGYHGWDGLEPYAVFPPCAAGRSAFAASHEVAELATDPQPYNGWASDTDVPMNGGEVADLCAQNKTTQDGQLVTQLWSNAANECIPRDQ